MVKKLFLLDGMALVYRAHFALISRPILTSKGVNTSALYGFTQTLLDILKNQQPTHLAVAFDTETPTHRHLEYPDYKASRQAMPEDLSLALPHVRRMIEAFRIPVLTCPGFEADDIIGTLVRRAEKEGFQSYMVTPDKDFGQLIDANTFIYKPGRMGNEVEILGVPEILARWGIQRPEQVVDVLALMGDSSDNIPGVAGIGEKTAVKLIGQFGSVEAVLERTGELTGRLKENLMAHREQALLSKRLATIVCEAPCPVDLEGLHLQPPDEPMLKSILVEFEFNSLGRRLFGEDFKAGHGGASGGPKQKTAAIKTEDLEPAAEGGQDPDRSTTGEQLSLIGESPAPETAGAPLGSEGGLPAATAHLKTLHDVPHTYQVAATPAERAALLDKLLAATSFGFDAQTTSLDPKEARLAGLAFSLGKGEGYYVPARQEAFLELAAGKTPLHSCPVLEEFRAVFESERAVIVGHNLKFDLSVLRWHGIAVRGRLFDAMVAHSLVEPEMRHGLDYLAEVYLGYTPIPVSQLIGPAASGQLNLAAVPVEKLAEHAAEAADLSLQLRDALEPLLKQRSQERVFYEIESPLLPVLVDMEFEGIRVDAGALAEFAAQLAREMEEHEQHICRLAGGPFNLNSPRQLGQVLFDTLKICAPPKKTRTGQYSTDEQTLAALAPEHEIVRRLLEYRAASKLKSTYADALPLAIWPATGRVHTTYSQVMTSTGRLNSVNPNLQNIPIRSERGQEIRKAFVPRGAGFRLLSADYSQIELRIIAALAREAGLLEAFRTGADVHTATAARVYGVFPDLVTPEMRRKAKMVNYGIAYGISAFGLAQRLGIPRSEAATIISEYFKQFSGVRRYMDETIAFAKSHGYVETVTGRRRYIRDINSANATVRGAAERNAINAPVQGTAADMIKLAMIRIQAGMLERRLRSRMLLQVHDELVFEVAVDEEAAVRELVREKMTTAIPLEAPIEVEIGSGDNWLEAH